MNETDIHRTVFVTGGHRGLGREIALRLGRPGGRIAIHYRRDSDASEAALAELRKRGITARAFAADLSKENEVEEMAVRVLDFLGRVDVLINCVGPIRSARWNEMPHSEWEQIFSSNFYSALKTMKAFLPGMRENGWGRIINLGYSRVEHLGAFEKITAYACAKTSLLILTRSAARSEAPFGITVNMVSPGLLEGGILPSDRRIPAGRLGRGADVAEAVRFLASSKAEYITGENLMVAGGWKL